MIHKWCLCLHINEIFNTFIGIFFLFFAVLRKQLRTKWFIYVLMFFLNTVLRT